jgi:hypothetical protein
MNGPRKTAVQHRWRTIGTPKAPDVLRAFAAWVTGRARKQRDGITITGQLKGCKFWIEVNYDGSIPDQSALDQSALDQSALDQSALDQSALDQSAPVKAVVELLSAIIREAPK